MTVAVRDLIRILETIAPSSLAEQWDNCGLQVGSPDWPVRRVWVALDPLPQVVRAAAKDRAGMLITHHPLLFRPLRSIHPGTPIGAAVETALARKVAVFCLHTNLDSAAGGLNDLMAQRIGLEDLVPMQPSSSRPLCKLVVFVPDDAADRLTELLAETRAGRIGRYSGCTFRVRGEGTFCPESGAHPTVGSVGQMNRVKETRIEILVAEADLAGVISLLRRDHPYEEMAYDVIPLMAPEANTGLGRMGAFSREQTLGALARRIKKAMGIPSVRMVGDPGLKVRRAAVCTGSGSSLMGAFLSSDAQVYISGDLHYHDARDAQLAGKGLIDVGHFGSEHLMVDALADRLEKELEHRRLFVSVKRCGLETDPFHSV